MRESLLNILMYVFENYLGSEENPEAAAVPQHAADDLLKAGFEQAEIARAINWFDGLVVVKNQVTHPNNQLSLKATRVFTIDEINKISLKARSYLLSLEQASIIDGQTREMIIDRVMALEEPIDIAEIKWVALMALFSQANKRDQLKLMEDIILLHDQSGSKH